MHSVKSLNSLKKYEIDFGEGLNKQELVTTCIRQKKEKCTITVYTMGTERAKYFPELTQYNQYRSFSRPVASSRELAHPTNHCLPGAVSGDARRLPGAGRNLQ